VRQLQYTLDAYLLIANLWKTTTPVLMSAAWVWA
jgi:hypothetical protein